MAEFVSQSIRPVGGPADAHAMARGEPALPAAFEWGGREYRIVECLERWKFSSREGAHAQGELYLRRHYFRVRVDDGCVWTVYFVRQTPKSGSPRRRWFLLEIDDRAAGGRG